MTQIGSLLPLFKEQLENEGNALALQHGLTRRGDHLIWWYFMRLLGLAPVEIGEVVCDGGNDLGLDAIRIDEEDLVHFYSFKNPMNLDHAFPERDVDSLLADYN